MQEQATSSKTHQDLEIESQCSGAPAISSVQTAGSGTARVSAGSRLHLGQRAQPVPSSSKRWARAVVAPHPAYPAPQCLLNRTYDTQLAWAPYTGELSTIEQSLLTLKPFKDV